MAQRERERHTRNNRAHSALVPAKSRKRSFEGREQGPHPKDPRRGSSSGTGHTGVTPRPQQDGSTSETNKRQRTEGQNWCRRCFTRSTSRWRTGPDGLRTLCSRCAFIYGEMKLTLFKDKDGNLSATNKEESVAVAIIGFETHPDGTRNLLRPLVALLISTQLKREPKLPAVSDDHHGSEQDGNPWCRKCGARESSRWRTGPDGFKTLCTPCSKRYVRHQLVLFQSSDGRVSAEAKPGWKPVAITGFKVSEKDNTRILSTPSVRPMTTTEVSKSPDTCVEYVPAPPYQASTSPQQSESRTSPSMALNIARQEGPKKEQGRESRSKQGREQALSETSRTLHGIIDANESEACKALLDLERNDVVALNTANAEPDTGEEQMAYSVKACSKSEGGVFLVRRFTVSSAMAYEEFANHLRDLFKLAGSLDITYEDDEGDNVTVSSNLELRVMMSIANANSISPIRVTVAPESQA